MTQQIIFSVCAGFAIFMMLVHEVLGSPRVKPPLFASSVPQTTQGLLIFSWHVGSVLMLGVGALYAAAVIYPEQILFAVIPTALVFLMAVVAMLTALRNGEMWQTPAPYAWVLFTLLGSGGLLV